MEQSIVVLSLVPPKQSEKQGHLAALKVGKGLLPCYLTLVIDELAYPSANEDQGKSKLNAFIKDAALFVFDGRTVSHINYYLGTNYGVKEFIEVKELLIIFFPSLSQYGLQELGNKIAIPSKKYCSSAHRDVRILLKAINLCWGKGLELDIGFLGKLEEYSQGLGSELFIGALKKELIKQYPDRPIATSFYPQETEGNLFAENPPDKQERIKFPGKWVVDCFQEGGLLSRNLPGYENRGMQAKMAEAIVKGFTKSRDVLIEAGTGTGKSLAYLIPALWWAGRNRKRVVIATHTITLQEQLYMKDLPLLQDILPFPFEKALLKGKSNYICLRSFYQDKPGKEMSVKERLVYLGLFTWLRETSTGDFNEVAYLQKLSPLWRKYGADNPYCQPGECRFARQCYLFKARKKADEADLIVINHSLLLADLKTNYKILPEYSDLVIDEAHNLYQTALKQLGFELSVDQIIRIIENLDGGKGSLKAVAQKNRSLWATVYPHMNWTEFFDRLEKLSGYCGEVNEQASELFNIGRSILAGRLNIRIDEYKIGENVFAAFLIAIENLVTRLLKLTDLLTKIQVTLNLENDALDNIKAEILKNKTDLTQIVEGLQEILTAKEGDRVTYLEKSNTLYLKNTVIDIEGILREKVFHKNNSTVLTSATLTVGGKFDYFAKDVGVEDTINLQLDSPFDYNKQMLFCIVNDLQVQQWSEEDLAAKTASFIRHIAGVMDGRSLILFTSHRFLRLVHSQLQQVLLDSDLRLLAQGIDGTREGLIEEFMKNNKSILLGTSSFWEGIDIPGDSLRCVIMSKLPFWPPDTPILEAKARLLETQGQDPFYDLYLPEAIIRFRQGFGRLIRTKEDKGVVILLDDRILSKSYGRYFLKALPILSHFEGNSENVLAEVVHWV